MKGFWMDDDIEDLELSNGKLEMKALQKLCRPACFVLEEFRTGLVVSKSGQRPLSGPPQNLQEGCRRELLRFLSCLRIASWSSSAIGVPGSHISTARRLPFYTSLDFSTRTTSM